MKVEKIQTRSFAKHDAVSIELPDEGVVLITGKNGHGKSTVIEAVAHGVWDRSLRGAPCWKAGANSGVEVTFDAGHVQRSVGKRKALKWKVGEHGAGEYPTRTKSQTALEQHVGSFDVWRRACTFSGDDASRFTRATDGDRKKLLEQILELDKLDAAHKQAREELRDAKQAATAARAAVTLHAERVLASEQRMQRAEQAAQDEPTEDLDALRDDARDIGEKIRKAKHDLANEQTVLNGALQQEGACFQRINDTQAKIDRVQAIGAECQHCGQAMDATHRDSLLAELGGALDIAKGKRLKYRDEIKAQREKTDALEQRIATLTTERATLVQRGVAAKEAEERRASWLKEAATAEQDAAAAHSELTRHTVDAKEHEATAAHLEAAVIVLGLQGARAGVLSNAVEALEVHANTWLAVLGMDGLTVRIGSTSETKTGAVRDKISFEVEGAGGGQGYLGASTGERRRIDIAVMLGLWQLGTGTRGVTSASTLFVDEVFDGLDAEGVESVVRLLSHLASERCVVVVSHSQTLIDRLQPVAHHHAEEGELKRWT